MSGLTEGFKAIRNLGFENRRSYTAAMKSVFEGHATFELAGALVDGSDEWFPLSIPMTIIRRCPGAQYR